MDITFDDKIVSNDHFALIQCYARAMTQAYPWRSIDYNDPALQEKSTIDLAQDLWIAQQTPPVILKAYLENGQNDLAGFAMMQTYQVDDVTYGHVKCLCAVQEINEYQVPPALEMALFDKIILRQHPETHIITALTCEEDTDFYSQYMMLNGHRLLGDKTMKKMPTQDLFGIEMKLMAIPAGSLAPARQQIQGFKF